MNLTIEETSIAVTKAILSGRMDIDGALSVDMRFSVLAGGRRKLVVDLSEVTFMASMGLRTLMLSAKTMAANGGRMALINPQPSVAKVLESSGIGALIGVYPDWDSAVAAISG